MPIRLAIFFLGYPQLGLAYQYPSLHHPQDEAMESSEEVHSPFNKTAEEAAGARA